MCRPGRGVRAAQQHADGVRLSGDPGLVCAVELAELSDADRVGCVSRQQNDEVFPLTFEVNRNAKVSPNEAVKSNTQELYLSSKSLKQRLSVVLKTVLEVGVQRFTSLFGIKK